MGLVPQLQGDEVKRAPPGIVQVLPPVERELMMPSEREWFAGSAEPYETGPGPDCYACVDLRPSGTCQALVAAAQAHGTKQARPKVILEVIEYRDRSSHDPHELCPHFRLADEKEIEKRLTR